MEHLNQKLCRGHVWTSCSLLKVLELFWNYTYEIGSCCSKPPICSHTYFVHVSDVTLGLQKQNIAIRAIAGTLRMVKATVHSEKENLCREAQQQSRPRCPQITVMVNDCSIFQWLRTINADRWCQRRRKQPKSLTKKKSFLLWSRSFSK